MLDKLTLVACESSTPYGRKYVAVIKVSDLLEDVFDNDQVQRAINDNSIKELKTDLLRAYKSDKTPFMASMIGSIVIDELKRDKSEYKDLCHYYNAIDRTITIPKVKGAIAIVDGGHRTTAFRDMYLELWHKIDTIKNASAKLIYKAVLNALLDTEITIDLYENLSKEDTAKLFLDVNKGHAISQGRKYYFEDCRFDGVVEYFSNDRYKFNINLDIDSRNVKMPTEVPYAYIYKLMKDTFDILTKARIQNPTGVLITLMSSIFDSIDFKKVTKAYFEDIKKLIKFYVEVNAEFDLREILAIITSKDYVEGVKGYKYYKSNKVYVLKQAQEERFIHHTTQRR